MSVKNCMEGSGDQMRKSSQVKLPVPLREGFSAGTEPIHESGRYDRHLVFFLRSFLHGTIPLSRQRWGPRQMIALTPEGSGAGFPELGKRFSKQADGATELSEAPKRNQRQKNGSRQ